MLETVVIVEYFVPDSRNDGGGYRVKTSKVEKISQARRVVVVCGESIRVNRSSRLKASCSRGSSDRWLPPPVETHGARQKNNNPLEIIKSGRNGRVFLTSCIWEKVREE